MVNTLMFGCSNRTKEDWCCVFSTIKIATSNCLTPFSPFISNGRLRSSEATKNCQVSKQNFSLFHFGLFLLLPVGANARQPLPFSLIGGSSDVIQSQQQRVELSISHGARCRKHTYVLNPSKKKNANNDLALPTHLAQPSVVFYNFKFFHFRPTGQWPAIGSRRAGTFSWCWPGGPGVRCDFSGAQQGEQEEPLWQRFV